MSDIEGKLIGMYANDDITFRVKKEKKEKTTDRDEKQAVKMVQRALNTWWYSNL